MSFITGRPERSVGMSFDVKDCLGIKFGTIVEALQDAYQTLLTRFEEAGFDETSAMVFVMADSEHGVLFWQS